jgi:uncharacterized membrane protein
MVRPTAFALWRNSRGGVAISAAAGGMMLCAMAAIVVDVGSIALRARQLQGAADLAALSAIQHLPQAQAAATGTAKANAGDDVTSVLTLGRYAPDQALSPASRFTPTQFMAEVNAVRVDVSGPAPLFFGRWLLGRDSITVTRGATAALRSPQDPSTAFSLGSRLARVDGGIANALLSALTGSRVSLSVMDYRALADAEVDLLTFMNTLAAELDVTAADYDTLLTKEVEAGAALEVLESLLDGRAGAAIGSIADAATGRRLPLAKLLGGQSEDIGGLSANVSALNLATAILEVANGDRQLALDVGARAGLANIDVTLAIGERPSHSPWLTVTDTGDPVIRTAQARLLIRAQTAQVLAGLARVDLPIVVEAAPSEARLAALSCDAPRSVSLDVRPGIARAWVGRPAGDRINDFKVPLQISRATVLAVPLVSITARADVEAADTRWSRLRFGPSEMDGKTVRTAQTTGAMSSVVSSLLGRLDVDVNVIGLGLGLGGLSSSLTSLLTPLGPVLDGVVNPVLDLLGIRLGEADAVVHGLRCAQTRRPSAALVG